MNPAQNRLYWAEFNDAWRARKSRGAVEREVWRKQLHLRAGAVDRQGRPKSSTVFNQADVDHWKGVCRGYYLGGDLDAQLEIERQPALRALQACGWSLEVIGIAEEKREAYIAGVYRNVQRKRVREEGVRELELREMPDDDLGLVVAALNHTAHHKAGKEHYHPRTKYASRHAAAMHDVGSRNGAPAKERLAEMEQAAAAAAWAQRRAILIDSEGVAHLGESAAEPAYVPPEGQPF